MDITLQTVDSLTRRTLPQRLKPPIAVIIHTTGSSDKAKILEFYRSSDGLQPHWFIDLAGTAYHIVDENKVAYHAAIKDAEEQLYKLGFDAWSTWIWPMDKTKPVRAPFPVLGYIQWRQRWPGLDSPLELVTGRTPNSAAVGIELQQPEKPFPGVIFGDAQYEACRQLVWLISERWQIKRDKFHVMGHSDTSPMRRCNKHGLSDPGWGFDFDRIINGQ